MTKAEMAAEPTMDEILASIRKIIAEEPIGSRPLPKSLPKGSSEKSPVSSEPSRWPELPAAGAPMFGDRGARQVPAAAMPAQATPAAPTTTAPLPLPARNEVAAGLPAADRVADPLAGPLADRVVDPLADALSRSAAVPSATPPLPEPTLPVPPRAGEARLTEAPSSRAPAMAAPPAVPTAAAVPPEFDRLAAALRGSASVAAMPGAAFATPPPPPPPAPPAPPSAAVMPTGGASSPSAGTGAARAVPAPAPFADDLDDLLDDSEVADHALSPLAGSPADAPEHVALPPIAPPRTEIAPQAAEVAPSGRVIARRSLDFGAIVPGREAEAPVPAPVPAPAAAPVPAPASGSAPASAPPPPDTPLPPVARAAPPSAGPAVTAPDPSAAPAASAGAATPQVAAAPALAKQEASKPTSQARAFDKMLSARIAMAVKPASRPAEAAAPVSGPVVLAAMPAKRDDTGTPTTADVAPARAAATDASALDGDEAAQSAFGALAAGLAASTDPTHPSEATSPDEEPTLIVDPAAAIAAASTAATPSNAPGAPVARDPSAMLRATASVQRAAEPSPAGPAAAAPPPPAAAAVPSASAGGALALGGVQMPAAGSPVGVRTVEDIVAELLRPMLREWLAENMPRIVEKALRIELAEGLKTVQHTPLKGPDAKG